MEEVAPGAEQGLREHTEMREAVEKRPVEPEVAGGAVAGADVAVEEADVAAGCAPADELDGTFMLLLDGAFMFISAGPSGDELPWAAVVAPPSLCLVCLAAAEEVEPMIPAASMTDLGKCINRDAEPRC